MIRLCSILFLSLSFSLSSAELLKFDDSKLSYSAKLNDKGTAFIFKFKNVSDKEVTVEKIKSSCSCMSIKSKFPFKLTPSAQGTVEAYYDFTGKVGFNRGNIEVVAGGQRKTLNVEVDIPVPVTINPRFIIWKKGDRLEKEVSVKLHPDWKGKIKSVKTTVESIKTQLNSADDGFTVKITPPSVDVLAKKRTRIFIHGEDEQGKHIEYGIYLILN